MGSNSPFNEVGEPIMDASSWRYEQELDQQQQDEAAEEQWWEDEARGYHEPWDRDEDEYDQEERDTEFQERYDEIKHTAMSDEEYEHRMDALHKEFGK